MPIGPSEKTWDMVALIRYRSAKAYIDMRVTKEYEKARVHRRAALYDSRLIMTIENSYLLYISHLRVSRKQIGGLEAAVRRREGCPLNLGSKPAVYVYSLPKPLVC